LITKALVSSPPPRIFSPSSFFLSRPLAARASKSTVEPASNFSSRVQVHRRPLAPERILEAELRHPALQRHLAAFKALEVHVAGAGFLALPAAPGGLAPARALATADTLLRLARPGGRLQLRERNHCLLQ
jgi:hypothetical protein